MTLLPSTRKASGLLALLLVESLAASALAFLPPTPALQPPMLLASRGARAAAAPALGRSGLVGPPTSVERLRGGEAAGMPRAWSDSQVGRSTARRVRGLPRLLSSLGDDALARRSAPKPSAVYLLVVLNVVVFLVQKFTALPMSAFYLNHMNPQLFQYVTSTLCHANAGHLSSNMFPLLVFGRLVEEEMGFLGLLLTFLICGAASNVASILLMPSSTLSLGASGAVFGLFTAAVAVRVSLRDFAWRSWVEVGVFGQYVWERLRSEVTVTAGGGIAGVNHVAHLGGAVAGAVMILGLRVLLNALEGKGDDPRRLG